MSGSRWQEAVVQRAGAAFYPTAGVRGSYDNRPAAEGPNADKNLFSTSGQVSWLVSDFGRREGTVRRERETLEARRFSEKISVEDVVFGVRRAFFDYLRAEALVRVEQDTVKDRETLVRQARGFFDVGTRPKIDVARAEASLFAAQAGLIAAQKRRAHRVGAAQERHGRHPVRGASGGVRCQRPGAHHDAGGSGEGRGGIARGNHGVPVPPPGAAGSH